MSMTLQVCFAIASASYHSAVSVGQSVVASLPVGSKRAATGMDVERTRLGVASSSRISAGSSTSSASHGVWLAGSWSPKTLRSQGSSRAVRTTCGRFWSKAPTASLGG